MFKIFVISFLFSIIFSVSEARIRMNKVKEAPKVCKVMSEDNMLSRDGKRVFGTLRHSLVFELSENQEVVSLIKDKGEKICEWPKGQWGQILKNNGLEDFSKFKFHIDEYKEKLYPYARKADGSYFVMSIPFAGCSLDEQNTRASLDLPKCEIPKKKSKKSKKRRSVAKK